MLILPPADQIATDYARLRDLSIAQVEQVRRHYDSEYNAYYDADLPDETQALIAFLYPPQPCPCCGVETEYSEYSQYCRTCRELECTPDQRRCPA